MSEKRERERDKRWTLVTPKRRFGKRNRHGQNNHRNWRHAKDVFAYFFSWFPYDHRVEDMWAIFRR